MKNLTLLLFVSCFLYSQESKTENKIYHIITTDNDTVNVSSYFIGHSLFGEVCEFTLTDGRHSKRSLEMIKKIEDSNGKELYPLGKIKEVKKTSSVEITQTYQIAHLKYRLNGARFYFMLAGITMLISKIDKPPDFGQPSKNWVDRQDIYGYIMGASLVVGGISLSSSE